MDSIAGLMAVGFTEYEARVYVELLRNNPATGYQLSKAAGIPRSMVYEALGRLSARGAVLKTEEGRATLYRPLPPDTLLDRHHQEHQRLIEGLGTNLRTLYTAQDEGLIWSINDHQSVLAYALQMIREASAELFLVLADSELVMLREEIAVACERGVSVGVLLTGEGTLDCGQVARHPPLESKLQKLTHMLIVVADNREALIADRSPEMIATITDNLNLVLVARQFVWMELFTQRIYAQLGDDLLARLAPEDRQIFESPGNNP